MANYILLIISCLFIFSFSFSNVIYYAKIRNSMVPNITRTELNIMLVVNILFIFIITGISIWSFYKLIKYKQIEEQREEKFRRELDNSDE